MNKCKRCGRCCYYPNEKGILTKCPQLRHVGDKTFCRIYKNRLNYKIAKVKGQQVMCWPREHVKFNYKDCPYNRPEWGEIKD